jgi:hypothetical protein
MPRKKKDTDRAERTEMFKEAIAERDKWGLNADGEHVTAAENLQCELTGRPVKWREEYPALLTYWMSLGHSFTSFHGLINVTQRTISVWINKYPEFAVAREIGEAKRLSRTEKLFDAQADSGKAAALIFSAKNHHKELYKDKEETGHGGPKIIVLNTGIQRDAKPLDYIHATSKKLDASQPDGLDDL